MTKAPKKKSDAATETTLILIVCRRASPGCCASEKAQRLVDGRTIEAACYDFLTKSCCIQGEILSARGPAR